MNKSIFYNILYIIRIFISIVFLIFSTIGILGFFYPLNLFSLQIPNLLLAIFNSVDSFSIFILFFIILFVFLFGNFYCSTLCPLGCSQEICTLFKTKKSEYIKPNFFRYFILTLYLSLFFLGLGCFIKYINPYFIFSSTFNSSIISIFILVLVLIFALFKNRLFCRLLCPIGALLGFISKFSLLSLQINSNCIKCGKCERVCSYSCIDFKNSLIENEICSNCLKCLSVCEHNAVEYKFSPKIKPDFNIDRRNFIIGTFSLLAIGSLIKHSSKNLFNKILSEVCLILPPNSLDKTKFINTCINCGLCVNTCPSKIIKNDDSQFPYLHFEYHGGYCKEDCNKCATVCPTAAIKNFRIADKHKIKIGEARVVSSDCTHCDLCVKACYYNAITKNYLDLPKIDKDKCIGCGACKVVCDSNTIEIFAIKD